MNKCDFDYTSWSLFAAPRVQPAAVGSASVSDLVNWSSLRAQFNVVPKSTPVIEIQPGILGRMTFITKRLAPEDTLGHAVACIVVPGEVHSTDIWKNGASHVCHLRSPRETCERPLLQMFELPAIFGSPQIPLEWPQLYDARGSRSLAHSRFGGFKCALPVAPATMRITNANTYSGLRLIPQYCTWDACVAASVVGLSEKENWRIHSTQSTYHAYYASGRHSYSQYSKAGAHQICAEWPIRLLE